MMDRTQDIYIIGAGGLGREAFCLLRQINNASSSSVWNVKGFVDQLEMSSCAGLPVWSHEEFMDMKPLRAAMLAIGSPQSREKLINLYSESERITYPNLIHPSVIIEDPKTVTFGVGNIICANVVMTTNIKLGNHNHINLSCTVGHDVVIGNNAVINPSVNISGEVRMGDNCLVGTGAQILQQLSIGSGVKIGAGAVVVKDVYDNQTVVGVPAKPIG